MAIQDSFNLSQATISQAYAYKCWYNYNYGGNTMQISSNDMGKITQTWQGELSNWRAVASNDENAYEIEDDDFSSAKMDGRNNAKDKTGYDGGGTGKIVTRGVVDAGVSVAGSIANVVGADVAGKLIASGAGSLVGKSAKKVAEKATEAAIQKGTKEGVAKELGNAAGEKVGNKAGKGGWIISAPLALATGTTYMAKKPNKEQKEACDALQDEMVNAQGALAASQEDMAEMDEALISLSDEAQTYNEDANENIEENKTEFDLYKESYEALMAKIEAGETLSDDEKELLKQLIPLMQELGVEIEKTSEDTTDAVSDIYDEMDSYQEGFDEAAATMGEVEGLTDFAESFDETTRTMCVVESVAQGLNAASGAKAAFQAGKFAASGGWITAWAWGFAAMGASGAAMSGVGVAQQTKWAGEVNTEIDMRKATQDLNSTTTDIYSERIDDYEGYMDGINDLELEIPDEIDPPTENPDIPDEGGESTPNTTSSSGQTTEDKDKKDKE